MSENATEVEDELGVPKDATLQLPGGRLWSLKTSNASIPVSAETAVRGPSARCLVVGRQAKVSDIRIQHGSISRKHAALYYLSSNLILQDFGSKKGTQLNGERLEGFATLKDGDTIAFGNVRESVFCVNCEVPKAENTTDDAEVPKQQIPEVVSEVDATQLAIEEAGVGLSGRAKREAEIAAMMNSLEQTPEYQKYVPPSSITEQQQQPTSSSSNGKEKTSMEKAAVDQITFAIQQHNLPMTERLSFDAESDRRHVVTCMAIDAAGSRFVVGTTDNRLRFYDFGGMDRLRKAPFKVIEADEGHVVADVCYSNTGDRILVGTGSLQPYILDRDGNEIIKFVRGDMYVLDQTRTTGHTASVTGVSWHPLERDLVLTSSADGSARLWDLNGKTQFQMLVCNKVFQPKSSRGQRTKVQSVAYHPGGREFAVSTICGTIQIWNTARASGRPERMICDAHGEANSVCSLVYSIDGSKLASRSVDDETTKVWDAKRLSRSSSPLVICDKTPTLHEHICVAFSADSNILCVGTSKRRSGTAKKEPKAQECGRVKFFSIPVGRNTSQKATPVDAVVDIELSHTAGVSVVKWHWKLNQIFMGFTDGRIEILFDPQLSSKGALLTFSKAGRQVDGLSQLLASRAPTGSAGVRGEIIAPNAIPIGTTRDTKRKRGKDKEDESQSRKPEPPAGAFKPGGNATVRNFTQFLVDTTIGKAKEMAGKDPREELLKYQEGRSYISNAYEGNEEKILAQKTAEQEDDEQKTKK